MSMNSVRCACSALRRLRLRLRCAVTCNPAQFAEMSTVQAWFWEPQRTVLRRPSVIWHTAVRVFPSLTPLYCFWTSRSHCLTVKLNVIYVQRNSLHCNTWYKQTQNQRKRGFYFLNICHRFCQNLPWFHDLKLPYNHYYTVWLVT